jgi:Cytotoxic translational repressor of toxin-antitoxin stability system
MYWWIPGSNPPVYMGCHDCYKIKLKSSGYRLVYQVRDEVVMVFVVAIGKREKSAVYHDADKRL